MCVYLIIVTIILLIILLLPYSDNLVSGLFVGICIHGIVQLTINNRPLTHAAEG